jgi:CTP synthase (UTP-ammonia lyase)
LFFGHNITGRSKQVMELPNHPYFMLPSFTTELSSKLKRRASIPRLISHGFKRKNPPFGLY